MANKSLPVPQMGRNTEETINNLIDTMMIYRKDLNFLMKNLSFENMPIVADFANKVEEDFVGLEGGIVSLGTEIAQNSREIRLVAYRTEEDPNIHKGSYPPENPSVDDLWLDNSASPNLLYMYDGEDWILLGEDVDNLYDELVSKDKIVSAIIASPEEIKISSNKILLEGITTINNRFQVLMDGSIRATNANISGTIYASSGSFSGGIYADYGDIGGFTIGYDYLYGPDSSRIELSGSRISSYYNGIERVSLDYDELSFYHSNGNKVGYITGNSIEYETVEIKSYSGKNIDIHSDRNLWLKSNNGKVYSQGSFLPEGNRDLGSDGSNRRWNYIYLKRQPDVDSDYRKKSLIQDIPSGLLDEIKSVEPRMYFKDGKWEFGYIGQDVERALYKYALKTVGFSEADNFMESFSFLHKGESYLSLLYGEIAVLKEAEINKRIEELEKKVSAVEGVQ